MRSRPVVVLLVVVVLGLVLGTTGLWLRSRDAATADPQAAAKTTFPDLVPATAEPTLPSLDTVHPAPGKVVQAAGPFDDRFDLHELAFDGKKLTGSATITSDVSEILEFQALAGFYDRDGVLIGTGRYTHHLAEHSHETDEGSPELTEEFSIDVPGGLAGDAVSAAVGVPVLVNE